MEFYRIGHELFDKRVIRLELQWLAHLNESNLRSIQYRENVLPIVDISSRPINIVELAALGARSL